METPHPLHTCPSYNTDNSLTSGDPPADQVPGAGAREDSLIHQADLTVLVIVNDQKKKKNVSK